MVRRLLILEAHADHRHAYRDAVSAALPPEVLDIRLAANEAEALAVCAECTALAALAPAVSARLIAAMPRLAFIQALTSGVDALDAAGVPPGVCVCSVRGIHGPQMSELALLFMLALNRDLPGLLEAQAETRWTRRPQRLLAGKTVLIVGIGLISTALAALCNAFGMQVHGVSARTGQVAGFAAIHPYAALPDAAAQADFVVVLAPYTPATHHLISAAVIARMQPTAFLINLARGGVVDDHALIAALRARRIAGAALDVFAVEPLPPDSPFWTLPNTIVTPHIGGMSDSYADQAAPVLVANLLAYCGTGAMVNIVRPGVLTEPR
jgi:phosphoglycerate dehydrogenase-like enzyme